MPKSKTEYTICKMYPRDPEEWERRFKSLKAVLKVYRAKYLNEQDPQDFRVFKIVTTQLRVK